ncbi:hypothetical protein BN2475_250174 [Paraburkholderia ribeironis]|uniref:Uncharacterized protein n=1 Tax=Paraburkholderia ribeironis TaxID=1247936 RepID=A0A1N7RZC6_9BURK|nr:hypothetical protein BN2475_250174 [Paraburkholderia ribeironis]
MREWWGSKGTYVVYSTRLGRPRLLFHGVVSVVLHSVRRRPATIGRWPVWRSLVVVVVRRRSGRTVRV